MENSEDCLRSKAEKRIKFDKIKNYRIMKKLHYRATSTFVEYCEIKESFADYYLHEGNPLLFNRFLKDVFKYEKFLFDEFCGEWEQLFWKKGFDKSLKSRILNKCLGYLPKDYINMREFWIMAQKHADLFKKI